MLHVITPDNRHRYEAIMETMWRQRHRIFIDSLGWDLPSDGIREKDDYDTADTLYLASIDDSGALQGSLRLIPTSGRHMMADLFPHLCDNEVPRGEFIWEISRLYSMTATRRNITRDKALLELTMGQQEYGLLQGIKAYTFVLSYLFLPIAIQPSWCPTPLGRPEVLGRDMITALSIGVSRHAMETFAREKRLPKSILDPVCMAMLQRPSRRLSA